ncbi:MAG: hypothetical protein ACNYPI_06545 [Arenicellales bacterium WSBS_2016_MAG_OTU3]
MTYLVLCVLASTSVLIVFRWMQHNGADTRHAILINYLVATITGIILFAPSINTFYAIWFWLAALEGFAFYFVFRLIGKTIQISGVAAASIATRMSVVIPVCVGFFLFDEAITASKLFAIGAGLLAVFLTSSGKSGTRSWKWPLLAFVATGLVDVSLKLFQAWAVPEAEFPGFITTIFTFAFITSFCHHLSFKHKRINRPSLISGVVLGVMNFGTVIFILKALAQPGWESSVVFPLNNFGVVTLSTLVAVFVFRERPTTTGWAGLGLAGVSIWLLYLSS